MICAQVWPFQLSPDFPNGHCFDGMATQWKSLMDIPLFLSHLPADTITRQLKCTYTWTLSACIFQLSFKIICSQINFQKLYLKFSSGQFS
jgi:hypothetical protein